MLKNHLRLFLNIVAVVLILLGVFFISKNKKVNILDSNIFSQKQIVVEDVEKNQDTKEQDIEKQLKVTVLELVEDSRCAKDVQCIWAGTVKIKVQVRNKYGKNNIGTLTLGEVQDIGGVKVTLTKVLPEKTIEVIAFSEYKFTFTTE